MLSHQQQTSPEGEQSPNLSILDLDALEHVRLAFSGLSLLVGSSNQLLDTSIPDLFFVLQQDFDREFEILSEKLKGNIPPKS